MVNERVTENFFRKKIFEDKLYKSDKIIIEEQATKNIKIDKLLKNASKSGGGKGYPEFIIQFKESPDFIIVVECKADLKKHESKNRDKYSEYAVDGVLLYSSFLSKEFDVLDIAISGEEKSNIRISHFLQLKGVKEASPIFKEDKVLSLEDYLNGYKSDEKKFNQDFQELLKYSKILNDKLHAIKVPEANRSLLISGILIALQDKAFCNSYKLQKPKELAESLVNTIKNKLTNVQNEHIADIITTYSFIKTHTILSKEENELRDIITEVDSRINNFNKTYQYFDTLGQFYIEFLRYANNDKGLGIVLTPPHITELFSEIANINKDSILLDTCCGTGGFLISAMRKMIEDTAGDKKKEEIIKHKQIIGVEFQHEIFALVCSNMFIHGDGRSNLIKGDCFEEKVINKIKIFNPNVGFLNPPYKTSKTDIEELEFVLNNLSLLQKGSFGVAIIPMSCVLATEGIGLALKERLLREHTLEAVFSMPNELFHNSDVTVNTCIIVLKAKEKHPTNYKTYFGYWKEDGFIKIKNLGRVDFYGKWTTIKNKWIEHYKNKEEIAGSSIKKVVSAKDEWCAEAYMETDYSKLKEENFIKNIKDYLSYRLNKSTSRISINNNPTIKKNIILDVSKWKWFKYDDGTSKSLFEVKKGKRLTKKEQGDGNIPYVSSSSLNNGIDNYIDNGFTDENCLSFACYGSIGEVFYQEEKVWVSDNANVFYLRNNKINTKLAMFLITLLRLEQFRFSYGMTGKKERLQDFYIKLPVDKKDNPDWQFMEDYINSLPYSSNL